MESTAFLYASGLPDWPIGCMINSCAGEQPSGQNVKLADVHIKEGLGLPQGSYVKLIARVDIQAGQELLGKYNTPEEVKWKC